VGEPDGPPRPLDTPRFPRAGSLRLTVGPREDWFAAEAVGLLCGTTYTVHADSNRIGLRLSGAMLERARSGELASEGMVLGAVQVPPSGQPVVFLADHPVTGGYPVIGVVDTDDLWQCAQLRPGDEVRFTRSAGPAPRDARR
jgi:allophanate hydrolase subunit 2